MIGKHLFYPVASRHRSNPDALSVEFAFNQTKARAAVEEIEKDSNRYVVELIDGHKFVEAWIPKDKKALGPTLDAIAAGDVDAFVAATDAGPPHRKSLVNLRNQGRKPKKDCAECGDEPEKFEEKKGVPCPTCQ